MQHLQSLDILVLGASALYFIGLASFLPGLLRGLRRKKEFPFANAPTVTILVCARNEEKKMDACLDSLAKINYPSGLLEILIVDDRSSDSTPEILKRWKGK